MVGHGAAAVGAAGPFWLLGIRHGTYERPRRRAHVLYRLAKDQSLRAKRALSALAWVVWNAALLVMHAVLTAGILPISVSPSEQTGSGAPMGLGLAPACGRRLVWTPRQPAG